MHHNALQCVMAHYNASRHITICITMHHDALQFIVHRMTQCVMHIHTQPICDERFYMIKSVQAFRLSDGLEFQRLSPCIQQVGTGHVGTGHMHKTSRHSACMHT
eukprot:1158063-Pelagomonas_calceolata.AAC.4